MEKKVVALIDCQNDFIDGALGVGYDKWAKAYSYIEEKLLNGVTELIFTQDYHPVNHCSFKPQNGPWPAHCVMETEGADIYWKLNDMIGKDGIKCCGLFKGMDPDKEEYGIDVLQKIDEVDEVNIAGLCTDYCVKESAIMTAKAHPNTKVIVHLSGSAYIAEDTKNAAIEQMKEVSNIEIVE